MVHFELAAALAEAEHDTSLSQDQQTALETSILADAYDIACRMLPDDIVDLLELTPKQPDNIAFEAEAPSLRGLYLLIHAYDHTRDTTLRRAIEYILGQTPPRLSKLLGEAYSNSLSSGEAVLAEYQKLAIDCDDELDETKAKEETKAPDATQASGEKLGKATLHLREING
jgi:hypothetical protein